MTRPINRNTLMTRPVSQVTLVRRACLLAAVFLLFAPAASAGDLLAPVRQVLAEREARLVDASDVVEKADLLLESGWHDQAVALIPSLLEAGENGEARAVKVMLAVRDFERLPAAIARLDVENPESRTLHYEWHFKRHDLRTVDKW